MCFEKTSFETYSRLEACDTNRQYLLFKNMDVIFLCPNQTNVGRDVGTENGNKCVWDWHSYYVACCELLYRKKNNYLIINNYNNLINKLWAGNLYCSFHVDWKLLWGGCKHRSLHSLIPKQKAANMSTVPDCTEVADQSDSHVEHWEQTEGWGDSMEVTNLLEKQCNWQRRHSANNHRFYQNIVLRKI